MIEVRRAMDRGRFDLGWLDTRHTFSFGDYHDPRHMGFGALRVLNEDRVEPGAGFGTHAHREMEIVSYVLEGALEHADSIGHRAIIRPGDVQRMTAGTGITHSERNASRNEPVHFLQIWIVPERTGLAVGYEQRSFDLARAPGVFRLVASRDGRDGSVTVHQDVTLRAARFEPGQRDTVPIGGGRRAWVQVVRGDVRVDGTALAMGDGAALRNEPAASVQAVDAAEVLVFDLA